MKTCNMKYNYSQPVHLSTSLSFKTFVTSEMGFLFIFFIYELSSQNENKQDDDNSLLAELPLSIHPLGTMTK